jgi:hypothetical protein
MLRCNRLACMGGLMLAAEAGCSIDFTVLPGMTGTELSSSSLKRF